MENSNFNSLIQKGESDVLAFLEKVDLDKISSILCSLLNNKGGNLVVGVDTFQNLIGVPSDLKEDEIRNYLVNKIIPESPIELFIEKFDSKTFLLFKVWEGTKQPYIYEGNIYFRKGNQTQKATSQEISSLIHGREKNELHWERQISFGLDWEDFDHELINTVMNESQSNQRSSYKGNDSLEFLSHYGLFNNGSFTNACVVLFAKNPAKYLPQTRVRITEYAEGKTDKSLLRDEILEGNLFEIRNKLETYVQNMGIRSLFLSNEWRRLDFKYPEKALQEGMVNALIHRDYSLYNSHLTISSYQDSIVIINSGKLPEELKVADLRKNHRSFPVNPDIAHITFLMGYIDKLGRGTVKILEECIALNLKEPKWSSKKNEVSLTFYGPISKDKLLNSNNVKLDDAVNNAINAIINDAVNDAVNNAVNDVVKVRLKSILRILYNHKTLALKDLIVHFNSSRPTIQRDILLLASRDLIKKTGSDRYREYELSNSLRIKIDTLDL